MIKDRFVGPDEIEMARWVIFEADEWPVKQVEEAARGMANGACNDPWPVGLKFWVELERCRLLRDRNTSRDFEEYKEDLWRRISGGEDVFSLGLSNFGCDQNEVNFFAKKRSRGG